MKRFDVYVKTIDGVNQQTIFGAIVTIFSAIVVFMLVISEITVYFKKDVQYHMIPDVTVGVEAVKLDFSISFHKIPCERIKFSQETTRGTVHTHEPEHVVLTDVTTNIGHGCDVHGSIITDKVGGNFRFAAESEYDKDITDSLRAFIPVIPPDLSHTIHHLKFLSTDGNEDEYADDTRVNLKLALAHPLMGRVAEIRHGIAMRQYGIQVVPTQYKPSGLRDGPHFNQYSVSERDVEMSLMFDGFMLGGQAFREFTGLVFNYDFYPVMLVMEEKSENFFEFITGLCGIVGGVITVLGLVDRFVYSSAKALIGKKD